MRRIQTSANARLFAWASTSPFRLMEVATLGDSSPDLPKPLFLRAFELEANMSSVTSNNLADELRRRSLHIWYKPQPNAELEELAARLDAKLAQSGRRAGD